jgi:hypothetical protein
VAFHRMKKLVAQAKANMSLKTDVKPQGN